MLIQQYVSEFGSSLKNIIHIILLNKNKQFPKLVLKRGECFKTHDHGKLHWNKTCFVEWSFPQKRNKKYNPNTDGSTLESMPTISFYF